MRKFHFPILVALLLMTVVGAACTPAAPTAAPTGPTSVAPAPTTSNAPAPSQSTAAPVSATGAPTGQAAGAPAATSGVQNLVPTPPADNSRPLAKIPAAQRVDRFTGPAPITTSPDKHYVATIVTSKGNIVTELYTDTVQSTNNFVTLAQDGFYDGLIFHRVEPGFVIQGGDPEGTGTGGPGYTIPAEINHKHLRGALAWARTGDQVNPERASSGSQFYVTLSDTPSLDGAYTVFGQVIQGMDVADQIVVSDTIKEINISEAGQSLLPTAAPPTPTREPVAPKPAEGRPLAKVPVEQRDNLYTLPPAMSIDPNKTYQAAITTGKGDIVVDLDPKAAPNAVNSFVVLSNLGYYDGMPVAFVRPEAYTVFGSPLNREDSDAGYALQPETPAGGTQVITGTATLYPTADQSSGNWLASGSQFLLWTAAAPQLDVPLSAFGKVSSGQDVVGKLAAGDVVTKIEIKEK